MEAENPLAGEKKPVQSCNILTLELQHLAANQTTGQDIEKTWERIQVFFGKKAKYVRLKFDAGSCGKVGYLWTW